MAQGIVPKVRSVFILALLGLAVLAPTAANALVMGPNGTWIGKMKTAAGEEYEVTLELNGTGATWSGTLKDPFMGELQLQDLKVTATRISFTFRPANVPFPANFSGSYLAAKDRITGTFSLRGTSRFVKFERTEMDLGATQENAEQEKPEEPARVRHPYTFAMTGRAAWWPSLHVVKEENYNINNMTKAAPAFDGALKLSVLDEFTVFGRYYRGGQNFTDNPDRLARYQDLGLTSDSYLKLDGWELGVTGYLGNSMMPQSHFNPYVSAAIGVVSWDLTASGRGSDTLVLDREPLKGDDMAFMFGIGTEYELSERLNLEFEWAWRFFKTKNETLWPDPDNTWASTHAWTLSAGATLALF